MSGSLSVLHAISYSTASSLHMASPASIAALSKGFFRKALRRCSVFRSESVRSASSASRNLLASLNLSFTRIRFLSLRPPSATAFSSKTTSSSKRPYFRSRLPSCPYNSGRSGFFLAAPYRLISTCRSSLSSRRASSSICFSFS